MTKVHRELCLSYSYIFTSIDRRFASVRNALFVSAPKVLVDGTCCQPFRYLTATFRCPSRQRLRQHHGRLATTLPSLQATFLFSQTFIDILAQNKSPHQLSNKPTTSMPRTERQIPTEPTPFKQRFQLRYCILSEAISFLHLVPR